jgi:hypothetical protein
VVRLRGGVHQPFPLRLVLDPWPSKWPLVKAVQLAHYAPSTEYSGKVAPNGLDIGAFKWAVREWLMRPGYWSIILAARLSPTDCVTCGEGVDYPGIFDPRATSAAPPHKGAYSTGVTAPPAAVPIKEAHPTGGARRFYSSTEEHDCNLFVPDVYFLTRVELEEHLLSIGGFGEDA